MHMNLFYFTVVATLKRCDFLPFHHNASQMKDMGQRIQKHSNNITFTRKHMSMHE